MKVEELLEHAREVIRRSQEIIQQSKKLVPRFVIVFLFGQTIGVLGCGVSPGDFSNNFGAMPSRSDVISKSISCI